MKEAPTQTQNIYRQRLLNVARALREDPDPQNFTMRQFTACGSPACALGHYASRRDLQDEFYLRKDGWIGHRRKRHLRGQGIDSELLQEHFGLNYDEMEELFGMSGCGQAAKPITAATYIEAFVTCKFPVTA